MIKKILSSYISSSNVISALNNALTYYGSSLASAFGACALYNCDADWFYNTNLTGTTYEWGEALSSSHSTFPASTSYVLPYLSAYYIKYCGLAVPQNLLSILVFNLVLVARLLELRRYEQTVVDIIMLNIRLFLQIIVQ